MSNDPKRIAVMPDEETYKAIKTVAKEDNRSLSNVVETVLKDWNNGTETIKPLNKREDKEECKTNQ